MQLDVSSLESVRDFARQWEATGKPLHILVNNAGVFHIGGSRRETSDGLEQHLATNHLGPFLLTLLLMPALRAGAAELRDNARRSRRAPGPTSARVVNVASLMHKVADFSKADPQLRRRFISSRAYGNSKLAQILATRELRRRLGATSAGGTPSVTVVALHPGMVLTNVQRDIPGWLQWLQKRLMTSLLLTPSEGARCSVYCATSSEVEADLERYDQQHQLRTAPESNPPREPGGRKGQPNRSAVVGGYFSSTCVPQALAGAAVDDELARWCYDWSVEVTGVDRAHVI